MALLAASARIRWLGVPAIAVTVLAAGACASVPTRSAAMQSSPGVSLSANELQLRDFEMGRNLSSRIAEAADQIIAQSTDPAVRRNAMLWKISAVPQVQEAALRNDPHVAGVDLLAFSMQQEDYFTTGSGRSTFGPAQAIAIEAARDAARDVMAFVSSALTSGRLSESTDTYLREWAKAHPMQGPTIRRASILASDWKALGMSDSSVAATLGNVDRTIVNISYRLSYLNETLAAEARWSAELEAEDALRSPRIDALVGTGTATLRSVGALADDASALLDRERAAVTGDIDRERVALMGDIDRERAALMGDIARERLAILGEIDRQRELTIRDLTVQRVALEATLTSERQTVMQRFTDERIAAFQSADRLAEGSTDRLGAVLRGIVWEIALAALLVVAAGFGGGLDADSSLARGGSLRFRRCASILPLRAVDSSSCRCYFASRVQRNHRDPIPTEPIAKAL